jgi:hypothetical protein
MVETDISRLLADLSQAAETLNRESNTINQLIKRFEERLRQTNVGLQVWCPRALATEPIDVSTDEETYEEGSLDTYLGWTKGWKEWELTLCKRMYRCLPDCSDGPEWELVRTDPGGALREAPRELRIEALKHFPDLLQTIEDAKRFAEIC